jgi:hypothetical protein
MRVPAWKRNSGGVEHALPIEQGPSISRDRDDNAPTEQGDAGSDQAEFRQRHAETSPPEPLDTAQPNVVPPDVVDGHGDDAEPGQGGRMPVSGAVANTRSTRIVSASPQ